MSRILSDFTIKITENDGILSIAPESRLIGAQHDNEMQRLLFVRPEKYADMDLVLYFSLAGKYCPPGISEPVNIGTDNEWLLTADITKWVSLRLQIAFMSEKLELIHSNIIALEFRPSISKLCADTPSIPGRIKAVEQSAFIDMGYQGGTLTFRSATGNERSVHLFGGDGECLFAFSIKDGDLILSYGDNAAPPNFHINEEGELIWQN